MKLYAGIDLHSNNSVIGMINTDGSRTKHVKVGNHIGEIINVLESPDSITGVVVESTYNWYWLVDGLMDAGFRVHLANPAGMQQYKGLKHRNDIHDAYWLAEMLRLGILPVGYIYPKEDRPLRDLLRTRAMLVRQRTSLILSLKNIITRNTGIRINVQDVKALRADRTQPYLADNDDLAFSGKMLKESIDSLTLRIKKIEREITSRVKLRPAYQHLNTISGVGMILALTIMLETGSISRFDKVGNYTSYCRKVPSKWTSNNKKKGKGNVKNGNRYLCWAFGEAAVMARRFDERARAYYNRKMSKTNTAVAHSALAHKLARAAYYIMRDNVPFVPGKVFG